MKHLLIDGDGVAYSICAGMEHEVKWDDDLHTLHSRLEDCVDVLNNYVDNLEKTFGENRHLRWAVRFTHLQASKSQ